MKAFYGTGALIAQKRRIVTAMTLAGAGLGLVLGLGTLGVRILEKDPDLTAPIIVALPLMALVAPLLAGGVETFSGQQAGSRPRREELLGLPIGGLALPAAIYAVSAAILLGCVGSLFGVYLAVTGGFPTLESTARAFDLLTDAPWLILVASAFGWAMTTAIVAIGDHPSNGGFLLVLAPMTVLPSIQFMGYGMSEIAIYAAIWTVPVTLVSLALPFILYARGAHHWGKEKGESGGPDLAAATALMVAVIALGLVGAGVVLAATLILGAGIVWICGRGRPPIRRRSIPSLRIATGAIALAFVPPIAYGLVADGEMIATARTPSAERLATLAVSPTGEHVAVLVTSRRLGSGERGHLFNIRHVARQLIVADVASGTFRPIPTTNRFVTEIRWSADGRFLAAADQTWGRYALPQSTAYPSFEVTRSWFRTAILDTRTGTLETLDGWRALRPGWRRPEELAWVSSSLLGEITVRDGLGRELALVETNRARIVRYEDGSAVIGVRHERHRWDDAGQATDAGIEGTWGPGTLAQEAKAGLVEGERLFVRGQADERAKISLGDEVEPFYLDDGLLASTAEGVTFWELPSGRRTELIPGGAILSGSFQRTHGARAIAIDQADRHFVIDPSTREVTPLTIDEGDHDVRPLLAVRDRVFGRRNDGMIVVKDGVESDGRFRPVIRIAGTAARAPAPSTNPARKQAY